MEERAESNNDATSLMKNLLEHIDSLQHEVRTLKARRSASASASKAERRNMDANLTLEGNIGDRHRSRPKVLRHEHMKTMNTIVF